MLNSTVHFVSIKLGLFDVIICNVTLISCNPDWAKKLPCGIDVHAYFQIGMTMFILDKKWYDYNLFSRQSHRHISVHGSICRYNMRIIMFFRLVGWIVAQFIYNHFPRLGYWYPAISLSFLAYYNLSWPLSLI